MEKPFKTLIVYSDPVAKARPRFNSKTGVAYTPSKTREAEEFIRLQWIDKWGPNPSLKPIRMAILAGMRRPKAHFGSGKNSQFVKDSSPIYPVSRPDWENLAKTVCDALNGVAYRDDSQIVEATVVKQYEDAPSAAGRWEISIWELN